MEGEAEPETGPGLPLERAAGGDAAVDDALCAVDWRAVVGCTLRVCDEAYQAQVLHEAEAAVDAKDASALSDRLEADGYFTCGADVHDADECAVLADAVRALTAAGYPATFILLFDEAWALFHRRDALVRATTGNQFNFDALAWVIDPDKGATGFSPHRDRQPVDVRASFREPHAGGGAKYTTCWTALTDATPDNSCLYVVPKGADTGYVEGDSHDPRDPHPIHAALRTPEAFQSIRALPVRAGGSCVFTHRILHWGGKGRPHNGGPPRVSIAFAASDDSFEAPYLDRETNLPFPSADVRLALACAQNVVYHDRWQLSAEQVRVYYGVFERHAHLFNETYRASVANEFMATVRMDPDAQEEAEEAALDALLQGDTWAFGDDYDDECAEEEPPVKRLKTTDE